MILRIFRKVFVFLLLLIALLAIPGNLVDVWTILGDPGDYVKIYSIGNSEHLQFSSIGSFVLWRILQMVILLPMIIGFVKILMKKEVSLLLKSISYIIAIGVLLWYLYCFVEWYQSGFDHYPGFDPYFL